MIFISAKGHGFTTLILQALFVFAAIFVGMTNEAMVTGSPFLTDIFPVICVEIGLLFALPFLWLFQKYLRKKGRTAEDDCVYGQPIFRWGVISAGGLLAFAAVIIAIIFLFP